MLRWDSAMTKVDSRLDALQARYLASLAGKRADIEQAWQALRADCSDTASQETLLKLVHRLAGSAESYGFPEIGRSAARTDLLLDQVRNGGDLAQRSTAMCAMLETLARHIDELLAKLQHGAESKLDDGDASS